jgi:hypothetical protein
VIAETLASLGLEKLASRRSWDLIDEEHCIRQAPFGELRSKIFTKFLRRCTLTGSENDDRQRALTLRWMVHGNHSRFGDRRMAINAFSSATELIYSPPDFTRSFTRSRRSMRPFAAIATTSPVRNRPSSVKRSSPSHPPT